MITPHVFSEYGRLRRAIVHDANNICDMCPDRLPKNTRVEHPEQGEVRRDKFIEQHAALLQILETNGVVFTMPDTQDEAYCQVFTRDAAFVVGNTLFVAGFRESYRRPELAGLASLLDQFPKVAVIDRGCLEGGDVVLLGPDLVLIGTNENSDQSGFDQASDRIRQDGISHVIQVRHGGLHLDCCLAPLPNGDGLFSPGRLSSDACDLLSSCFRRLVALDPEEDARHLAANLLWVDEETVVSNIHVPKTNALLRSLGFQVLAVDYTEAIHAWGSIRCTVCPLVRAN